MNPWIPVVLGVVGAALSALAAYAIAKRQRSGKIDTTEAETLWAEGQAMRQELREEVINLRIEAVAARNESSAMRVELATLRTESTETHKTMATLREECAALHAEIIALRAQMADETASREKLTDKLDEAEPEQKQ